MKEKNIFIEEYNRANSINIKSNLDIYDECNFSFLDILKEKEVEVVSKVYTDCKCVSSTNFNLYYSKCDKCDGKGTLKLNSNEVICNHCKGSGKIVKEACPICEGEGKVIKRGNVSVKLNKNLKDNDVLTIKGKGKNSNGVKGDLFIKVRIFDKECFEVVGNDVYDKRLINFTKEEINKGCYKEVETIKGYVKVKSNGVDVNEVIKLEEQGIASGDFYVCLNNELTPLKGEDVYKNVVINKEKLGFYFDRKEFENNKRFLQISYFKKLNDYKYDYIELEEVNNFKVVKIKGKGKLGKNNGENGDLYLRVYFDDEFACVDDEIYHIPVSLNKYEISEGKKIIEFNKNKISLSFPKNLSSQYTVEVDDYGFIIDKNKFENINFVVSPFEKEIYRVSVKVSKKDKVIYLENYKKYFNELVDINYSDGLRVSLSKKSDFVNVLDEFGNQVIVNIVR